MSYHLAQSRYIKNEMLKWDDDDNNNNNTIHRNLEIAGRFKKMTRTQTARKQKSIYFYIYIYIYI